MADFIGTHQGKLDAKGRVSVPAAYRASLKAGSASGNVAPTAPAPLYLRPSHKLPCLEGFTEKAFARLEEELDKLPEFSDEHADLATALYSEAIRLEADKEGRIVLPAELIGHAGLNEGGIAFLGKGKTFEIWDASTAERRKIEARERAAAMRFAAPGVVH